MHQQVLATLLAHSLEEHLGRGVKINARYILALCHCLHGCREITVSIAYGAVIFKETADCRRAEDDVATFLAHTVNKRLQLSRRNCARNEAAVSPLSP